MQEKEMPGPEALQQMADTAFHVEGYQYGVIEDMHMMIGSILDFYLKQCK